MKWLEWLLDPGRKPVDNTPPDLGPCDMCGAPATSYEQTVWALLCWRDSCFQRAWDSVHD